MICTTSVLSRMNAYFERLSYSWTWRVLRTFANCVNSTNRKRREQQILFSTWLGAEFNSKIMKMRIELQNIWKLHPDGIKIVFTFSHRYSPDNIWRFLFYHYICKEKFDFIFSNRVMNFYGEAKSDFNFIKFLKWIWKFLQWIADVVLTQTRFLVFVTFLLVFSHHVIRRVRRIYLEIEQSIVGG